MTNERLRAALLERGFTPSALGEEIGVDHKIVERWVSGRVPYRRHQYAVVSRLAVDEVWLVAWGDGLGRFRVVVCG
jgi:transcriptional regulator with XRE-family HTH domain